MTVCAYQKEDDSPDDLSRTNVLDMRKPETKTFKHFMGTFLLRRAHYFSEAWHQSSPVAGQGLVK